MSLAKAKSDDGIWLWRGYRLWPVGLGRGLRRWRRRLALNEGQNFVARPIGDQPAAIKQEQAIDHAKKRQSVCGDDDCHSIAAKGFQTFQKFGLTTNVKMRRRL